MDGVGFRLRPSTRSTVGSYALFTLAAAVVFLLTLAAMDAALSRLKPSGPVEGSAFDRSAQERALLMTDNYLVDFFRALDTGGRERTFDWVVHGLGRRFDVHGLRAARVWRSCLV